VPVVDNHTHLDAVLAETDDDGWRSRADGADRAAAAVADHPAASGVAGHLAAAAAVGVDRVIQIGCDLPSLSWTDAVVREHRGLVGGLAIHPNEAVLHAGVHEIAPDGLEPDRRAHHGIPLDEAIATVADRARANDRIRVIGETGLDHFRAGEQGRAVQREAFRAHIVLAKELGLVLQIHDRDAHEDVLAVLAADGAPERTVFHCFSGDAAMAEYCVERGWYLSFAGSVTFSSARDLRAALHVTPLERLLLETDAPYLAPHPFRGRPNAPVMVAATARAVATELDVDLSRLCAAVSASSEALYGPW
jgi:TatD DNase family protein